MGKIEIPIEQAVKEIIDYKDRTSRLKVFTAVGWRVDFEENLIENVKASLDDPETLKYHSYEIFYNRYRGQRKEDSVLTAKIIKMFQAPSCTYIEWNPALKKYPEVDPGRTKLEELFKSTAQLIKVK